MFKNSYQELTSRNNLLIGQQLQEKIHSCHLLFIGCGLASQAAILAARTGFANFTICDGDKVDLSNLNRQYFTVQDIGKNKAEAVAENIKSINPEAQVKIVSKFVEGKDELNNLMNGANIVINSADPGEIMFWIDRIAAEKQIPVFSPFNIGHNSLVFASTANSMRLDQYIPVDTPPAMIFFSLIMKAIGELPADLDQILKEHGEEIMSGKRPAPQLGTTTYLNSLVLINLILKWLKGEKLQILPKVNYLKP